MSTFTEEVVAAMKARGWEIHHMESYGFEWWWIPAKHKDYWQGARNGRAAEDRDWYMPFRDAIGQALLEDELAARKAEPLIPRGTGKIITDEKHGEQEFDCALDVIRARLSDGYWYEDWTGPRDNPGNDPGKHWKVRAESIVETDDEPAALAFLIERRGFEYERFYFEHPEPSEVSA